MSRVSLYSLFSLSSNEKCYSADPNHSLFCNHVSTFVNVVLDFLKCPLLPILLPAMYPGRAGLFSSARMSVVQTDKVIRTL